MLWIRWMLKYAIKEWERNTKRWEESNKFDDDFAGRNVALFWSMFTLKSSDARKSCFLWSNRASSNKRDMEIPPLQCLWWPGTSSDPTKKPKGSYFSKWFQNVSDVSSFINRQQWAQQLCSTLESKPTFWSSSCILLSVWADWHLALFIIFKKKKKKKILLFKVCEWLRFAARAKFDWDKPSIVVDMLLGTNDSNAVLLSIVTIILLLILKL